MSDKQLNELDFRTIKQEEDERRELLYLVELMFKKDWDSDEDEFWDDY